MAKIAGLNLTGKAPRHSKKYPKSSVATRGGVAWWCGGNPWDALPASATAAPQQVKQFIYGGGVAIVVEVLMIFFIWWQER